MDAAYATRAFRSMALHENGSYVRYKPLTRCAEGVTVAAVQNDTLDVARRMLHGAALAANSLHRSRHTTSLMTLSEMFPGFWLTLMDLNGGDKPRKHPEEIAKIAARGLPQALAVLLTYSEGIGEEAWPSWLAPLMDDFDHPEVESTERPTKPTERPTEPTERPPEQPEPPERPEQPEPPEKIRKPAKRSAKTAVEQVEAFVSTKAMGDSFKTGELLKVTGLSRAAVSRACAANSRIRSEGRGAGARWVVVS